MECLERNGGRLFNFCVLSCGKNIFIILYLVILVRKTKVLNLVHVSKVAFCENQFSWPCFHLLIVFYCFIEHLLLISVQWHLDKYYFTCMLTHHVICTMYVNMQCHLLTVQMVVFRLNLLSSVKENQVQQNNTEFLVRFLLCKGTSVLSSCGLLCCFENATKFTSWFQK